MPARLPGAEQAVGLRLHLCQHLVGLRLCGVRHRRLRPPDRRLGVSRTARANFVLDALEQALHERWPAHRVGLVHHSDRGSQYASIRYSERLAEAGIEPSVGSVGDSYDDANLIHRTESRRQTTNEVFFSGAYIRAMKR